MMRKRAALFDSRVIMPHQPYTKQHRSAAAHIDHLRIKGLFINDAQRAEQAIKEIGYYRLRIYFLSRRSMNQPGRPFQSGISFDDIIEIYRFDQELRAFCFQVCSRVEIIFRNMISEILSERHGAHPFFLEGVFNTPETHMNALRSVMDKYLKKKSSDQRAKHYYDNYNPPMVPPIWTVKDFWTFGDANYFYMYLNVNLANDIAREFALPDREILNNWISCLIDLRNICSHHDRLFNRSFQKNPSRVRRLNIPSKSPPNKLHSLLEISQHIIRIFEPTYDCLTPVSDLIARTPVIVPSEVGF